jgi:hypothetical protein
MMLSGSMFGQLIMDGSPINSIGPSPFLTECSSLPLCLTIAGQRPSSMTLRTTRRSPLRTAGRRRSTSLGSAGCWQLAPSNSYISRSDWNVVIMAPRQAASQ